MNPLTGEPHGATAANQLAVSFLLSRRRANGLKLYENTLPKIKQTGDFPELNVSTQVRHLTGMREFSRSPFKCTSQAPVSSTGLGSLSTRPVGFLIPFVGLSTSTEPADGHTVTLNAF
ncbi:hypothetical protein AMECASPLE_026232 [Ameca splendens]|uniref:Uncharacterized protein n=1 Tax=Ameca splendens TaxID=208324 RepID=A0ABV1A0E3_9TELE